VLSEYIYREYAKQRKIPEKFKSSEKPSHATVPLSALFNTVSSAVIRFHCDEGCWDPTQDSCDFGRWRMALMDGNSPTKKNTATPFLYLSNSFLCVSGRSFGQISY
jgi:hypothetical protein